MIGLSRCTRGIEIHPDEFVGIASRRTFVVGGLRVPLTKWTLWEEGLTMVQQALQRGYW